MVKANKKWERLTRDEFRAIAAAIPKRNKFGAKRTTLDGHRFHSKAEADRYAHLLLLERAGEIMDIELQPHFPLFVNGQLVAHYFGDFRYLSKRSGVVVEDVKGHKTQTYKLKKKLVEACYPGVTIIEVAA